MSHTAAASEWLVWSLAVDERRSVYKPTDNIGPIPTDLFVARCRSLAGYRPDKFPCKGEFWYDGSGFSTLYNHAIPPNAPSCYSTPLSDVSAAVTAASLHPGGVNVLFADGHVRFARESVAPAVWRALGTCSGGEVVPAAD
jgi:prepilin-type processing-associated H-X9-DG protein